MPFTYLEDYTASVNNTLLQRTQIAIVATAIIVSNEGVGVAGHAARLTFAQKVLASPATYAILMAPGITSDGATDSNVSDVVLLNRVFVLWNVYSGNVA